LVVALLVVVAACGSSHSTTPTTNTNPAPPTKESKHFDTVLRTTLTSAASVPKGPRHGSGSAVVRLSKRDRQACWTITTKRIDKPLSAHVRKAPPGKVGPVIIPLGARFTRTGCVNLPLKAIKAVSAQPTAYYVDVLTRKYLNGALRGQLRASH